MAIRQVHAILGPELSQHFRGRWSTFVGTVRDGDGRPIDKEVRTFHAANPHLASARAAQSPPRAPPCSAERVRLLGMTVLGPLGMYLYPAARDRIVATGLGEEAVCAALRMAVQAHKRGKLRRGAKAVGWYATTTADNLGKMRGQLGNRSSLSTGLVG